MGVVSEEEQGRRAGGLAGGVMIFTFSVLLAIPVLGKFFGLFILILLVKGIFIASSNRLADFGILLALIVAYIASLYFRVALMSSMGSIAIGIVLLPFIVSFIGLSYFQKKLNR